MSRLGIALGLALVVLGTWWYWPEPTEEDRVRAVVHAIVEGAENADVGDVLDHVSEHYAAADAGKPELRAVLTAQFLRRGPITVLPGEIAVSIDGNRAHARFDALLAESSRDWTEILPVSADGWHLEVDFAREDGAWRVVGAERTGIEALP